jgi:hypothetical protein
MFLVISYLICSKGRWVQLPLQSRDGEQQAMGEALVYRHISQTMQWPIVLKDPFLNFRWDSQPWGIQK